MTHILIKLKNITALFLTGLWIGLSFTSCSDYLDVRPKSQIPIGLHFERESGFTDQLTGVYSKLCEESLYGREMTFGLVEVLAQNYDLESRNVYEYAAAYRYTETNTKNRIDAMWAGTYNAIANLNVILNNIDDVDRNIFTENHYQLYKGEALGLRSFLYFDLLRLFATSYAENPGAPGIPYVTEYAPEITAKTTVGQTLDNILSDLTKSVELLAVDSLKASATPYTYRSRRKYFNYFAAELTLARAYLYKGDKTNALKHANVVIEENEKTVNSALTWTHFTALETSYEYECDRTFSTEQIFQLNLNRMEDITSAYFTAKAGINTLSPNDNKADLIYEKTSKGYGNDYRMNNCFKFDGVRVDKYLSKFWQYENGPYNKIFPLIRLTEAYYIAAEALKDTEPAKAVELLNTVRSHRKLTEFPLSATLSANEIQEEIFKEYRKEFLGEGQLFYYYKRLNLPVIDGAGVIANNSVYVLPLPDNEIEFGQ
ncbi:MAG: RagB/SusD family nutrient uptake outer membrane protein, partial [Tannerella sp.]|nr:RagB/SusD family nutrient uptake outer membrane protein [Tannerella sp.]